MVYNGIDPNNILCVQRFFSPYTPTKYQYVTSDSIVIPTGRFFDTIEFILYFL